MTEVESESVSVKWPQFPILVKNIDNVPNVPNVEDVLKNIDNVPNVPNVEDVLKNIDNVPNIPNVDDVSSVTCIGEVASRRKPSLSWWCTVRVA